MISGRPQRRRRALAWSTLASAVVHIIFLTLLFYAVAHLFIPRGAKERITQTNTIKIEHEVASTPQPTPKPKHVAHIVAQHESAPARTPRRELAKIVQVRAPALPPPHRPTIESKIERDRSGFAKEVAQLNAQNDVHAIPTIDPGSQESASKTYAFEPPASMRGDPHGNGIITPTRDWHDSGRDCYYGRYEFTYPDGAMESGTIVWPFCYDPDDDPFKLPPHSIPFPLPLPGFRLTSVDELPPIEKSVYEQWISGRSGP